MKTFCLCLPENQQAIDEAKARFEEEKIDVEFFYGINAEEAGLATWHTYERDAPGSGFKMGSKPTGIWLSHYMLWNCVAHMNEERVTVFESDVKFDPKWRERLDLAMKTAPSNFDFLYVGHCCTEGFPKTLIGGDVFETKNVMCTHAYIIRRGCIPFLLKTLRRIWAPIDIQLQLECFPALKVYAVIPRIFSQWNTDIPT